MQKYQKTFTNTAGDSLAAATIDVWVAGTTPPRSVRAAIWDVNDSTQQQKANPFPTTAKGVIAFYTADGKIDVRGLSQSGLAYADDDVTLFDAPPRFGALDAAVAASAANRDQANGALQAAEEARALAAAEADNAQAAALASQNYAAAATNVAGNYATIAAGVAGGTGVAVGKVFVLIPSVHGLLLDYYRNVDGTTTNAVFLGGIQAGDVSGTFLPSVNLPGYSHVLIDSKGRVAFGLKDNGTVQMVDLEAVNLIAKSILGDKVGNATAYIEKFNFPGYASVLLDSKGRIANGTKEDGTFAAAAIETLAINTPVINNILMSRFEALVVPKNNFSAEIVHFGCYGQSLSIGFNTGSTISKVAIFDNLKFSGGVRPQDSGTDPAVIYASFQPLVETKSGNNGETPGFGSAQAFKELIASENGTTQSYQILVSADGEASKSVEDLSLGTVYFTRFMLSMQKGYELSAAAAKSFDFLGFQFVQGESDNTRNTPASSYKASLLKLQKDIEAQANTTLGVTKTRPLVVSQVATHKTSGRATPEIAIAQLAVANESAGVICAGPMYQFTYQADNSHLTASSSKRVGFQNGLAMKRFAVDGVKFQPLQPISSVRQGNVTLVKFNVPKAPLVFDTTAVAANTNMGFELVDSAGAALTLTSVALVGPDTLKLVTPAAIATGSKLRYAWLGTGDAGPITGPRGNLRDSQGDTIVFDPAGLNARADNWCVMFEFTF